jgi:hypothetical protein
LRPLDGPGRAVPVKSRCWRKQRWFYLGRRWWSDPIVWSLRYSDGGAACSHSLPSNDIVTILNPSCSKSAPLLLAGARYWAQKRVSTGLREIDEQARRTGVVAARSRRRRAKEASRMCRHGAAGYRCRAELLPIAQHSEELRGTEPRSPIRGLPGRSPRFSIVITCGGSSGFESGV